MPSATSTASKPTSAAASSSNTDVASGAGNDLRSAGGNSSKRRNKPKKVTKFLAGDQEPVEELKEAAKMKSNGAPDSGSELETSEPTEPGESAEVCFICAEPIKYSAVSPCNHRSCHVCALRMRALYKTNACVHCRTIQPKITFTIDNSKRYEDYKKSDIVGTDAKLGIDFDRKEIMEDTERLQKFNCPQPSCPVVCGGWGDLRRHVTEAHKKYMCQLCTRNKKVFTHEHKLYTHKALLKHERVGDDEGFSGHPECQFCRTRFYSIDELRVHYRENHERCHICDKHLTGNSEPQYFLNYDSLEHHFRERHFLCAAAACLEKKFVVFDNEIDLKAHQISEHPNIYGTNKLARTIDTGFHFTDRSRASSSRTQQQQQFNWSSTPSIVQQQSNPGSSSAPIPRDQLALQRSVAAAGRVSSSRSAFGSQLSSDFGQPVAAPSQDQRRLDDEFYDDRSSREPNSSNRRSTPTNDESPSVDLQQFRQQRVDERAAQLLTRGSRAYESFKQANAAFAANKITAKNLISMYLDIFDSDLNEMTILIHEFVELFDDKTKKAEVLKAWNEWKARNSDFPALPTSGNKFNALRPSATRPINAGSVWAGSSSASSSSSSSSRARDSPSMSSLAQKVAAARLIPMSAPSRSDSSATSRLAIPMAPSQSASAAYANAWIPSTTPTPAPQKLTFATSKPASASSSSSSSSATSSAPVKLVRKNLKDFPPLPAVAKKPAASSSAQISGGWAKSAAASNTPVEQPETVVKKKGKKNVVVFRI